jgi:ABC-type uncharacterized transport system permease subunit
MLMYLIVADIRIAMPLLLAALGELYMEKSGVVNVGIEGFMLIGALVGSLGSYYFNNVWMGAILVLLFCGILGVIYSFLVVTHKSNQIVMGIAINIFSLGITGFAYRMFIKNKTSIPYIPSFKDISIPLFSKIPILGDSLFNQPILVYLTLLLVLFSQIFFDRTYMGLKVRAVGEDPQTADTMGINVFYIRYIMIIVGSMLQGLGGAFLSTYTLNFFSEGMVAGRGFVALAIVIAGLWTPWRILAVSLFFAFGEALHTVLQIAYPWIPYQLLLMLPYVFTIGMLIYFSGKGRYASPAANGIPYIKE